jgi:hypothetical protein
MLWLLELLCHKPQPAQDTRRSDVSACPWSDITGRTATIQHVAPQVRV